MIDGHLVGIIALRDISHICLIFVQKEFQRKGIAKKLFLAAVDHIKTDGRKCTITVNSSPYAVEIYHRLGFKDTTAEQTTNGIRFTPMEYSINRR